MKNELIERPEERSEAIREGVNIIDRWWQLQGENTVTVDEMENLQILELPLMD